jgi:hypothetical protein
MDWLYTFFATFASLAALVVTYLYTKSATFRYIVRNPRALVSLIKALPKGEEEKMEFIMNDKHLKNMFKDSEVQNEFKTNMKKFAEKEKLQKQNAFMRQRNFMEASKNKVLAEKKSDTNDTETASKNNEKEDKCCDEVNSDEEKCYDEVNSDEEKCYDEVNSDEEKCCDEVNSDGEKCCDEVNSDGEKCCDEKKNDRQHEEQIQADCGDAKEEKKVNKTASEKKLKKKTPKEPSSSEQSTRAPPPRPDFSNPMFRSMIQNPEFMLSMMPDTPQKLQLQTALQNPAIRKMMTNPDLMQSMMSNMPPPPPGSNPFGGSKKK